MASDAMGHALHTPRVCPACGAPVTDEQYSCAMCGARATGPDAERLRNLNDQITEQHYALQEQQARIAQLRAERDTLVVHLRSLAPAITSVSGVSAPPPHPASVLSRATDPAVSPDVPPAGAPDATTVAVPPAAPGAVPPAAEPPPPPGVPITSPPVRPQAVLATAGVLALGAAAAVFAAVSWTSLPESVQLGILLAVVLASALGARALERREIRVGAGGLALLAVLVVGVIVGNIWDSWPLTVTMMVAAGAVQIPGSRLLITRVWVTVVISLVPILWLATRPWPRAWMDPASVSLSATLAIVLTVLTSRLLRRPGWPEGAGAWLRADEPPTWRAIDVLAIVTATPWTLLAIAAALSTIDIEPLPGVGLVLVAPYLLGARWLATRRSGWSATLLVFGTYAVGALGLVLTIAFASVLSLAVASLVVALVLVALILGFEPARLHVPAVLGAGIWLVVRIDLTAEPIVRVVRAMFAPDSDRPTGLDLDTAAALVAVMFVTAAAVWAARGARASRHLLHIAALGAAVLIVLVTPSVIAAFVFAAVLLAIAVARAPAWPGGIVVVAGSAGILGAHDHGFGLSVFAVVTIAALVGAWRTRRPEFDGLAGLLPPIYVLAAVTELRPHLEGVGLDLPQGWAGVASLLAAGVLLTIAVRVVRPILETGVWFATAFGLLVLAFESSWWPGAGFAAVAVGAGLAAVVGGRRGLWWVARVAVTFAVWNWLSVADITVIELYTAVPALLLAGLGLVQLRRDDAVGSWLALGPAMSIVLLPSLVVLLADPGHLARVLGLLAAGAAVALAGWLARLSAPLVMGAIAVASVAIVQIGVNFDLFPRWLALSLAGALLLAAAITYDAQTARARRIGRAIAAMR